MRPERNRSKEPGYVYTICFVNANMFETFLGKNNDLDNNIIFYANQSLNYMILLRFEGNEVVNVIILLAKFHKNRHTKY